MKCLGCSNSIDWRKPVIYIGYNRAVHVEEWVEFIESHEMIRIELEQDAKRKRPPE